MILAQLDPLINGARDIADNDPVQQLTFVLVLMSVAGVVFAVAILTNESKRRTSDKEDRQVNRELLQEMILAVKQSAQAQADLSTWKSVIDENTRIAEKNTKIAGENAAAISQLIESIKGLAANEQAAATASTAMGHSLEDLRREIHDMTTSNKSRIDAIEKLTQEIGAAHQRGAGALSMIEKNMEDIRALLDRMDKQFIEIINRFDSSNRQKEASS